MTLIRIHRIRVNPKVFKQISDKNKETLFKWKPNSSNPDGISINARKTVGIETTGFPPNFQQFYRYKMYFWARPKDLPWNQRRKPIK